jgi:hypothetical protein
MTTIDAASSLTPPTTKDLRERAFISRATAADWRVFAVTQTGAAKESAQAIADYHAERAELSDWLAGRFAAIEERKALRAVSP